MLFIDDGKPEIVEDNAFLKQSMRANHDIDRAVRETAQDFFAPGAFVAAGQQRQPEPGGLPEFGQRLVMLAGKNFGWRHQRRLPPRFNHRRHGEQRDNSLARSDIALQQPQHPRWRGKIRADFGKRGRLRSGEREWKRGGDLPPYMTIARTRAAGRALDFRTHQGKRQLGGEQFVEGKPSARRRLRRDGLGGLWVMHIAQGSRERRQGWRRERFRHLPFRQRGDFGERRIDRLAKRLLKESLGRGIDRLHQSHLGEAFGVQHTVRMHHLPMPVPKFELSGNPARGTGRQAFFDPAMIGEKEDEEDIACFVLDQDLIGRLGARPRRPVLDDPRFERDDRIERRVGDFWPVAAVDGGMREMEKKVERAGFPGVTGEQPVKEFGRFRPDTGQAGRRSEEGIQERWTHGSRNFFVAIVHARANQRKTGRV